MSEFNPTHIHNCRCTSCMTQRHRHQAFPESTLIAGLFAVGVAGTPPVKLADLTDTRGVKLSDRVPGSALTVKFRSVTITDYLLVARRGNGEGKGWTIDPQASVELAAGDIETHEISSSSDGAAVAVCYTRMASDQEGE